MKRTSSIMLALALAGSIGCGGAKSPQPQPQPEPDPGQKTCRNPDLESCGTQPDPTATDAGVEPTP